MATVEQVNVDIVKPKHIGSGDEDGFTGETSLVSDSSAHGAEMLIRLKEGVGYVYPLPQGYISEASRHNEEGQGDNVAIQCHERRDPERESPSALNNSVAIQVNDYEIERRSGVVPARRRLIPFKFRDFQDPEDILTEQVSDEDYDPAEAQVTKKPRKTTPRPGARGVGRPRKIRNDHAYDRTGETTNTQGTSVDGNTEQLEGKQKKKLDRAFPRRGRPPKDDPLRQPKIYKCLQCDKKFSLKGNLKVHMFTHTDERPFECEIPNCGKAFRSNESLRRHNLSHQGIKLFGCEICEKRFSSAVALKEHMARHTDTKDQVCPVCERAFRQLSCLRRHMTTHTSDLPHACTVCNKRFSQAVYLRSHMRSHTGERPYRCDTCGKTFAHQSDKMRHMTIHLGTKPYVCEVCEARFSDPSTRRRHVREHNGFKPYTCQLCGDTFKRSGQLKAHLNKKHMNKEDVIITKQTQFNTVQYQLKDNTSANMGEVVQVDQMTEVNKARYMHKVLIAPEGKADGQMVTYAAEQDHVQVINENGQIQHVQVQHVNVQDSQEDANEVQNQEVLGHIQQQLVQAGFSQSQLVGNHIILAQTNTTNQEELLEETQKIIQQIQNQLDPSEEGGSQVEGSQQVKVAYHILHDDESQQIVEIQYHPIGGEEAINEIEGQTILMDGVQMHVQGEGVEVVSENNLDEQMEEQGHLNIDRIHEVQGAVNLIEAAKHIEQQQQQQVLEQQASSEEQLVEQQQMEQRMEQQQIEQDQMQQHYEIRQVEGQARLELQDESILNSHSLDDIRANAQLVEQQNPLTVTYNDIIKSEESVTIVETQELSSADVAQSTILPECTEITPISIEPDEQHSVEIDSSEYVNVGYTETDQIVEKFIEDKSIDTSEVTETLLTLQNLEQQQQQASVDYVSNPDFNCQKYYNWLSSFTELCKLVPIPLDVALFQKISQVHKTLSDVLATPRGILTNRENFRTLMNISKELNGIINDHLTFVLQNLDTNVEME